MLEDKIAALTAAVMVLNETITTWMNSSEEEESEPEPEPEPAPPPVKKATKSGAKATKPAVTLEQVREKLREVSAELGAAAAKAIVAKMKVKKVDELKAEQYAQAIELCNEALAEADEAEEEEDDL